MGCKKARGVIAWRKGDEFPEVAIRRQRDEGKDDTRIGKYLDDILKMHYGIDFEWEECQVSNLGNGEYVVATKCKRSWGK